MKCPRVGSGGAGGVFRACQSQHLCMAVRRRDGPPELGRRAGSRMGIYRDGRRAHWTRPSASSQQPGRRCDTPDPQTKTTPGHVGSAGPFLTCCGFGISAVAVACRIVIPGGDWHLDTCDMAHPSGVLCGGDLASGHLQHPRPGDLPRNTPRCVVTGYSELLFEPPASHVSTFLELTGLPCVLVVWCFLKNKATRCLLQAAASREGCR